MCFAIRYKIKILGILKLMGTLVWKAHFEADYTVNEDIESS